jgi:type III restriction enzyme
MEEKFVKKVQYVAEMLRTRQPEEEKWQLVLNRHEELRCKLRPNKLRPLTIVVTKDISGCKDVAEKFKAFLKDQTGKSSEQLDDQVLVIHSGAPDLPRLASVNNATSKVEWVFSVSMLNEGWDVKRVFQIVPHEKRAFESKLLIAQVLGRGLRVPDGWKGPQPEVTIFNHDRWADDIRHLVHEVLEFEKRIPTFPVASSEFNFELLNIKYDPKTRTEIYKQEKPYQLFKKGYVDLSTELPEEEMTVEFEEADTGERRQWKTKIKHKTYTPQEIAGVMFQRFEDLADDNDRMFYAKLFSVEKLEGIVRKSLKETGNAVITESIRQKFLQSLGTLQRKETQVVRYDFEPTRYYPVPTIERPQESVSASDLKNSKTLFFTSKTKENMPDEYKEFYEVAIEAGSGFKCINVQNRYDFKTPLSAVIADHDNERKFVRELISPENAKHIDAWIKSTPIGFYEIDYFWKKGEHPKRGKFNPDFFMKIGKNITVVEIKGDEEIDAPSIENRKKREYAFAHFKRINSYCKKNKIHIRYNLNFLTPIDFSRFFQCLRENDIATFRSQLDVALSG